MGEHVGPNLFRIGKITIQRKKGTFASFVRIVAEILAPLKAYFDDTKHNYTRFNYLGEWHSHHSFALTPSAVDHATMLQLATDSQLGAHFVVLVLLRLEGGRNLEGGLTVYQPDQKPFEGILTEEKEAAKI